MIQKPEICRSKNVFNIFRGSVIFFDEFPVVRKDKPFFLRIFSSQSHIFAAFALSYCARQAVLKSFEETLCGVSSCFSFEVPFLIVKSA